MDSKEPRLSAVFAAVSALVALLIRSWALDRPAHYWPVIALAGAFPGLTLPLWLKFRNPTSRKKLLSIFLACLAGASAFFAIAAFDQFGIPISLFLPFSLFRGAANPAIGLASFVITWGLGHLAMKTGSTPETIVKTGLTVYLALLLPMVPSLITFTIGTQHGL
jgi:hypothetical protein